MEVNGVKVNAGWTRDRNGFVDENGQRGNKNEEISTTSIQIRMGGIEGSK